jgi:two-component system cell cycle sensor histidine kinase/response regulator CckA
MDNPKASILIVDDTPSSLHLLASILTRQGYHVLSASDGPSGLSLAQAEPPDLILLDVMMPCMSGYEVCEQLRENERTRDVPVIFISALDQVLDKVKGFSLGGVDYITKPFHPREVLARVETHLDLQGLQKSLQERNAQLQQEINTRRQAEETLRQRNRELALLNKAGQAFVSTLDLSQVLASILEEMRNLLGAFASSIWLIDTETNELVCHQATGAKSEMVRGWRMATEQGLVGWVIRHGKSLIVSDTQSDQRYFKEVEREIEQELHSILAVPLRVKDSVVGVLEIVDEDANRFTSADLVLLESLAATASIAIENARLVEDLEAEIVARTAEIVTERDKSAAILRSVADGIAMVDMDMIIQYINDAFTNLTGYTAQEALGHQALDLIGPTMSDQDRGSIQLSQVQGTGWQGETVVRRKDGRTYEAALNITSLRDAHDCSTGYVISHRDISQRKDLDRARRQFTTNVSHQLRTPVTTIQLYAHLLQQEKQTERSARYLQAMESEITRLIHLIQDILTITQLDSGQATSSWELVFLPTLIENCVNRFQSQAEASGLNLVAAHPPPDLPMVKGSPIWLNQALEEIVDNALIFTPSGGRVTIETKVAQDQDRMWATITVQDTGPGISSIEQENVFDRFFRGELAESGHVPGTGLGLSIAQEIVQAHGGRVTLKSNPGVGTAFTAWLPPAE